MDNELIKSFGHVPTVEQQERIAAAARAVRAVCFDRIAIDEETARLIGLPLDQIGDPEAIMRAATATRIRNSHCWSARAAGVSLDANGNEVKS